MIARGTLLASLIVIEFAIIGGAISAIQENQDVAWSGWTALPFVQAGPHIIEGGPHQVLAVGARPALTVDIGYADLTIVTHNAPQIDVAVSKSDDFGAMRATSPISAHQDGDTVRIATRGGRGWSLGDNRMVTVVVPPQTQITVVHAGIIKASGLRAEASFTSMGTGSITIEDYNGPALYVSARDRISLHEIAAGRIEATSSEGLVEGTGLRVRYGSIESREDRVTLGFAAGADTTVVATADGTIETAGLDAATALTAGRKSDDDDRSKSQTLRIGPGNGHLDVRAKNGNVELFAEH